VYAKNPLATYAGQSVKINSKKDIIEFIKRFAISGTWSIVVDIRNGKKYKVMKKGKKVMQIPIQSLNSVHHKKFEFDFNNDIFKYYLSDDELNDIELVLANKESFKSFSINSLPRKRRDKQADKKD
jgi:hypothetical protein